MRTNAVAYIIFNRPQHTKETFAAIRSEKPEKLFIIADGPRADHATDAERCHQVREIVKEIDWPCDVYREYAQQNMGLKQRVSSGLDWVFRHVDRTVVLEDDCLPHPDFFLFCNELLDRYERDGRIWVVTGNNFQDGRIRGDFAYYFSKYNHCWGWATWRRAWQHYKGNLPFWPDWKNSVDFTKKMPDRIERRYWTDIFDRVWRNEIDSWAYPWTASVWYHDGLTATPNMNLVTNIGIGPHATHTLASKEQDGVPTFPIGNLSHPPMIQHDKKADRYVFDRHFGGANRRLLKRLMKLLPTNIIKKFRGKLPIIHER